MILTEQEIEQCFNESDGTWRSAYKRIEAKLLEKLKAQEPDAWRVFDGEGGYDYLSYVDNEKYQAEFLARNPSSTYKNWVEPLYLHPLPPADVVRDAERYRWLRDSGKGDDLIRGDCRGIYLPESSALDQAIDSAMEKS